MVVPADQIEQIELKIQQQISDAKLSGNPLEAQRLEKLADRITDKLSNDSGESIGITKAQANEIGRTGELPTELKQRLYELQKASILKKALKTGMSAAILTFSIEMAPQLLKMLTTGEINTDELVQVSKNGGLNATQSFVVATTSSWVMQTNSVLENFAKDLSSNEVAAMVMLTYNTILTAGKCAMGKISVAEMSHDFSRDVLVTGTTLLGSTLAVALVPEAAGPILVAQLVGSMIGALLGSKAYDAGNNIFLGLSAKYGWTMFGIVDQDYHLSDQQLINMGFDVSELDKADFEQSDIELATFDEPQFDESQIEVSQIKPIRRGVVGVNRIGYLEY